MRVIIAAIIDFAYIYTFVCAKNACAADREIDGRVGVVGCCLHSAAV